MWKQRVVIDEERGHKGTMGWVVETRDGATLRVDVSMEGDFHLPLDVTWTEAGASKSHRFELVKGPNSFKLDCEATPEDIAIPHLGRLPGRHKVKAH